MDNHSWIMSVKPVIDVVWITQRENSWVHVGGNPDIWGDHRGMCKENYLGTCGKTPGGNQEDTRDPHGPILGCAQHGGDICADLQ